MGAAEADRHTRPADRAGEVKGLAIDGVARWSADSAPTVTCRKRRASSSRWPLRVMIQCAYCLDVHTRATKKAGVSAEELAEVTPVSAAVQAGATMAHGTFALRLSERRPRTPLGDLASVAAL